MRRLDLCLERLGAPEFAEHVRTDPLTVPKVAEHLADAAGLKLAANRDGTLRGRLRRAAVGVRHIRFD